MDRTGKIAVALALIVMVGWTIITAKLNPPPPQQPAAAPIQTAASTPATTTTSAAPVTPEAPATQPQPVVTEPALPEQTQKLDAPSLEYTFTNHGGGISRVQLHQHTVEEGKGVLLNEYGTVPIGAISDLPAGADANASYTATTDAQGVITYQRTTPQGIQITKKFTLPTTKEGKDQYIATLDVTFTNKSAQPYKSGGYFVHVGSAAPIHIHDLIMYTGFDWFSGGKTQDISVLWFNEGKIPIIGYQTSPEKSVYAMDGDAIGWAGVYSQYFTNIVTPLGDTRGKHVWARRIPLDVPTHESGELWTKNHPNTTPKWYAIDGALGMPGFDLEPGKDHTVQFRIYMGPRQYQLLKELDRGESGILHLGWFGFVSKFLLTMMNLIEPWVGGYAVTIIVLTLLIKFAMWPLQNKATQSMKKMQALSPKMTELRDKYKDDPARMNQETIKLYKTYGVNPLSGCLPMVIQLPIFIGFYTMLGSAIELRNSHFFWVHDLSQPDTIGHLPGLGWAINILPLCMAATNVWMMAITPKSGDAAQQKMMMFMPLIFLWICYSYASGLALYMMVSNLFSVAQLYITRNQAAPTLEKIAADMAARNKQSGKKKR